MAEEEKGFIIRDRRGGGPEAGTTESSESTPGEPLKSASPSQGAGQSKTGSVPPINFPSFIISMGTSALMYLGESPESGAAPQAPNLTHAQEIIDILTLLETKTKGNLTSEEEALLEEMLYTLRIKFVEKASAKKP